MIPVFTDEPIKPRRDAGTVSAMNVEQLTIANPLPNPKINLPIIRDANVSHI